MQRYSQRDPRWAKIILGFGDKETIGSDGCTITSIGNVLGVPPTVVNDRLKAVNGFNRALVIWAKLEEAFPGVKIRRVWSYNNDDVKANVPHVIVEVNGAPIGGYRHWVQFLGNQRLLDPWDGTEKATSSYPQQTGYCVITGNWNQATGDDILVNKLKAVIDSSDTPQTKVQKARAILAV